MLFDKNWEMMNEQERELFDREWFAAGRSVVRIFESNPSAPLHSAEVEANAMIDFCYPTHFTLSAFTANRAREQFAIGFRIQKERLLCIRK